MRCVLPVEDPRRVRPRCRSRSLLAGLLTAAVMAVSGVAGPAAAAAADRTDAGYDAGGGDVVTVTSTGPVEVPAVTDDGLLFSQLHRTFTSVADELLTPADAAAADRGRTSRLDRLLAARGRAHAERSADERARIVRASDQVEALREVQAGRERSARATRAPSVPQQQSRSHWDRLADCESGNWVGGGSSFEQGSARWDWGVATDALPPWASLIDRGRGTEAQFHGGLQFHPDTWRWVAGDLGLLGAYPYAYTAPRHVQIEVAELTQQRQGWGAWPVCSVKVGLRG